MDKLEKLIELVNETGFTGSLSFDSRKVNVSNARNELVGQFAYTAEDKLWFTVFDTDQDQLSAAGEGGECSLDASSIKDIIHEFSYRKP